MTLKDAAPENVVASKGLKMSNGVELPLLGLGTWQCTDPDKLRIALEAALDIGYRYFDTAAAYGNEHVLGEVFEEYIAAGKLKRSDLFITTKLPMFGHKPAHAEQFIQMSLTNLRTEYIDLFLIHSPAAFVPLANLSQPEITPDGKFVNDTTPHIDTYRVMEKFYKAGVFRAIGVSNFNANQLLDLYDRAEIKPHNLQIELHILLQQRKMRALCKELNIVITSFTTLGNPNRMTPLTKVFVEADCLGHPLTLEMAKKYNRTPAQILLRFVTQLGVSVIPKSVTPSRLVENFNSLNFKLDSEDVRKFESLNDNTRLLLFDFAYDHPEYPFPEDRKR